MAPKLPRLTFDCFPQLSARSDPFWSWSPGAVARLLLIWFFYCGQIPGHLATLLRTGNSTFESFPGIDPNHRLYSGQCFRRLRVDSAVP